MNKFYREFVLCASVKKFARIHTTLWQFYLVKKKVEPDLRGSLQVTIHTFQKYSSITAGGVKFNCNLKSLANLSTLKLHPVLLEYFMLHSFHYNNRVYQYVLAAVSWLRNHHTKDSFGKPLELWWKDLFDAHFDTFIPVRTN